MLNIAEIIIKPELKLLHDTLQSLGKIIFEIDNIWSRAPSNTKTGQMITTINLEIINCMRNIEAGNFVKPKFTLDQLESCFRKPKFKAVPVTDWDSLKKEAIILYKQILTIEN